MGENVFKLDRNGQQFVLAQQQFSERKVKKKYLSHVINWDLLQLQL